MNGVDLLRSALPVALDPELAEASRRPFLRQAALDALRAARHRPAWATPTLAAHYRRTRKLGSHDRRTVQAAVLGVIRHEHILERAGRRGDADLLEGWARVMEGDRLDHAAAVGAVDDYAAALSVGPTLAKDWLSVLGPVEAAALAQAINQRAPIELRANRLRCDRDALQARLQDEGVTSHPHARAPDGLVVEGRANLVALRSFREGWFEVQDGSSQLLCAVLPFEPGARVVDVCAGAGGKSLALAARGARVEAWDVRDDALKELAKRARRAGADVVIQRPKPAPIVLVDAPCSGSGRLRRTPAIRWALDASAHLDIQADLLDRASDLVEAGGLLVYATCSLDSRENAHTPPRRTGPWQRVDAADLWPHRHGTDGFAWRAWQRG